MTEKTCSDQTNASSKNFTFSHMWLNMSNQYESNIVYSCLAHLLLELDYELLWEIERFGKGY